MSYQNNMVNLSKDWANTYTIDIGQHKMVPQITFCSF